MNGSTTIDASTMDKSQIYLSNYSLTQKSKKSRNQSEFGIRVKSTNGSKKRVDKNKKYIKQIINNNLYLSDNSTHNTVNQGYRVPQDNYYLTQPRNYNQAQNEEDIDVNENDIRL